jgi:dicarboxylate transporter 10
MNASGNDGPVKLLMESLKKEGPRFLFKGWLPAWSENPSVLIIVVVEG